MKKEVQDHFDKIAPLYDGYKRKNAFYYSAIKRKLTSIIPRGKRILDFGCGTGEILVCLKPSSGVGYDISPKIIAMCRLKFKNYKDILFTSAPPKKQKGFDYILLIDVVEHISNLPAEIKLLARYMDKKTKLIVTFVDSSWELILGLLEFFKLKMPEGPHKRLTTQEVIKLFQKNKFKLEKIDKIPLFRNFPLIRPISMLVLAKK